MSKIIQTANELNGHLSDNIGFLKASCQSFDAGFVGEAKRLATTIRVLLHDTNNSRSLLGLLGKKNSISYLNTATPYDSRNLLAHHGLVGFRIGPQGAGYWAPLGDGPPTRYENPRIGFDAWWNEQVIVDGAGENFTRRDLVLTLANKDGGAHVDPELDVKYVALTRGNSLGWVASDGNGQRPLSDVELFSVRQIAYELLESLKENGLSAA